MQVATASIWVSFLVLAVPEVVDLGTSLPLLVRLVSMAGCLEK